MIVVDTSAVAGAVLAHPPIPSLKRRLAEDGDLHAPHLVDIEFLQVLRRLVRTGELGDERAADARVDFADLNLVRYPHQPLADRVWELRANLTAYDAVFVALAEALEVPLITLDRRIADAPSNRATVELHHRPA